MLYISQVQKHHIAVEIMYMRLVRYGASKVDWEGGLSAKQIWSRVGRKEHVQRSPG